MAPLQRGKGECWRLISDGKAPVDDRRELNLRVRWEQAKGGSAGG